MDTICVKCAKCLTVKPAEGEEGEPIYFCRDPGVGGRERVNPVTGKKEYLHSGKGGMYASESPFPHCENINLGNCPMFEGIA